MLLLKVELTCLKAILQEYINQFRSYDYLSIKTIMPLFLHLGTLQINRGGKGKLIGRTTKFDGDTTLESGKSSLFFKEQMGD